MTFFSGARAVLTSERHRGKVGNLTESQRQRVTGALTSKKHRCKASGGQAADRVCSA